MKTYEDYRKETPLTLVEGSCENCSYWVPDIDDDRYRILKIIIPDSELLEDVWIGKCSKTDVFTVDMYNDMDFVGDNLSGYRKGCSVWFGYNELPTLSTTNTFNCEKIKESYGNNS